jgi:hypothetical protein
MSISFLLALVAFALIIVHAVWGKIPLWIPVLLLTLIFLVVPYVR